MKIPKGTLFILTYGEYEEYVVLALCKAEVDIDVMGLREEYLSQHEEERKDYDFRVYQFAEWLTIDKKMVKEISHWEWHLGAYGEADFDICFPDKDAT